MLLTEQQRLEIKTNSPQSLTYLSIYRPRTLLACRVNDASVSHGQTSITFDGVTTGSYANVFKWATVLIGTGLGKDDVGKTWVRSCTSSVLVIGLNSIEWEDNLYITILNFVDIWNRPFSVQLLDEEIVYKIDGDTDFSSDDIDPGTFISMGGNYAGFVGDRIYWDASESENIAGNSVVYNWEFEGGNVSAHTGSIAGYVTYNTPGHYKTKLTVTAEGGAVNVGYRYVSIYDHTGVNAPYQFLSAGDFSGSRDDGGWSLDADIGMDSVSGTLIGAPAILFSRHYFTEAESDLFKILFSGYLLERSSKHTYYSKLTNCLFGSASELMKRRPMTAVSVDSAATADSWTTITEMTVKRFLYYYLNYYSTALMCFDIRVLSGFDTYVKYFETSNGDLYTNIFDVLNSSRDGNAVFDRLGTMWVEQEPSGVDSFETVVSETFGLEDSDFLGEISIEENSENSYGMLEMGGFSYSGTSTNILTPLLSHAPDKEYIFYSGNPQEVQGLAINDQDELNIITGNVFAHKNAKYKNVEFTFSPVYLNFDISPLENIPVTISSTKNNLGISWFGKKFYLSSMSIEFNPEQNSILLSGNLHEVTQGYPAETFPVPSEINPEINVTEIEIGEIGYPVFPPPTSWYPPIVTPQPPAEAGCLDGEEISGPYSVVPDHYYLTSEDGQEQLKTLIYTHCNLRPADVTHKSLVVIIGQLLYLHTDGIWRYSQVPSAFTVRAIGANQDTLLLGENELNSSYAWALVQRANLASWMEPISTTEIHGFEIEISNPTNDGEWNADFDFASYGALGWSPVGNNPSYPNGNVGYPYPLASYSSSLSCYGTAGGLQVRSVAPPGDIGYNVINIWAFRPEVVFPKAGSHIQFSAWAGSSFTAFGIKYKDASWEFKSFYNPTTQDWYIGSGSYNKEIEAFAFHNSSGGSTWQTLYYANFIGFGTSIQEYRMNIESIKVYNVCGV